MKWLAAIVDSSDDAIIGKTLDSVIRSWNSGAERVFGYTAAEIVGQSILALIPPELQGEEQFIIERLSRKERVSHYQTVRVRKDGRLIDISLTASPILDDDGNVIGASKIARDVTEANRLRRAERELAEQLQQQAVELEQQIEEAYALQAEVEHTNEELQRALESASLAQAGAEEANQAKSRFLATMSHELRTPLNAIGGYVDLIDLEVRGPVSDEQRVDLYRIKLNQRILLRLIEDVLDFAKLESGRQEYRIADIQLDDVLRHLEASIAPTLRAKGLTYHFEPCGADAVACADRNKVEQIMLNLLSNAAKFTDEGRVDVRCLLAGDALAIEVADTGRGIAPAMLEMVFEPFVQEHADLTRTVQGTGLGLAISRQLARGMGGDVTVTSVLGKGSTFTLRLPRARDCSR
jgi:two-component system sensor histidine kinase/response regulator